MQRKGIPANGWLYKQSKKMTTLIAPTHNFTYDGAVLNIYHANKGEWHEIEALEDGTVFINVFAEGKQ